MNLRVCVCVFLCLVRVMHDEVSDTENIRKNLAIERMIVEGCDILLDTSQTFVRQGESASAELELCHWIMALATREGFIKMWFYKLVVVLNDIFLSEHIKGPHEKLGLLWRVAALSL